MTRLSVTLPPRGAFERTPVRPQPEESLDRATIAELSSKEVSRMTRGELERVVRASPPPGRPVRPEYLDHDTLRQLAYLARLACRNRAD